MNGRKRCLQLKNLQNAGISYPVVIKWLKAGTIPAEQEEFRIWRIPVSAVERFNKPENRPRKGRPPSEKAATKKAKKAGK